MLFDHGTHIVLHAECRSAKCAAYALGSLAAPGVLPVTLMQSGSVDTTCADICNTRVLQGKLKSNLP